MEDDPAGWALLTSPEHRRAADRGRRPRRGCAALLARSTGWTRSRVCRPPRPIGPRCEWPFGIRTELLGVSARVGGAAGTDADAVIFAAGDRQVAAWLYPRDPDLPGLVRAAFAEGVAQLLSQHLVLGRPVTPGQVRLELVGYRPRRRAVLRADVAGREGRETVFLKVLKDDAVAPTVRRHELLSEAGLPVPEVVAVTDDQVLVLPALPGRTLAHALFDDARHPATGSRWWSCWTRCRRRPPSFRGTRRGPPRSASTPIRSVPRCRPPAAARGDPGTRRAPDSRRHPARHRADPWRLPRGTGVRRRRPDRRAAGRGPGRARAPGGRPRLPGRPPRHHPGNDAGPGEADRPVGGGVDGGVRHAGRSASSSGSRPRPSSSPWPPGRTGCSRAAGSRPPTPSCPRRAAVASAG